MTDKRCLNNHTTLMIPDLIDCKYFFYIEINAYRLDLWTPLIRLPDASGFLLY